MVAAFGPDELAWWSPARFGQALTSTRILFAAATNDFYIPWAQGTDLRDKILAADPNAYVDLDQLAAGTVPFVHAGVTQESLDAYYEHELQLVAPLG
jgi:hypothetical protein